MWFQFNNNNNNNNNKIFDKHAVSEMGLRYFFKSVTGLVLGKGDTSAIFQIGGSRRSLKDALIILVIGKARNSE